LKQNKIVIISGRKKETLGAWLNKLPVDLVGEHGMWSKEEGGNWIQNGGNTDTEWKEESMDIMNFYVDRTPGSFVEEKSHSLAWHYRKVEKGLGEVRKSELTSHLKHMMNERGFHVLDGDHVIELKPDYTNKGKVARQISDQHQPDFTICVGDDTTDEYMFEALPNEAFTIKVGIGSSHARFGLESVKEVRALLDRLISLG
jgi:trehalose 6-phosphate synthase/phosphatase